MTMKMAFSRWKKGSHDTSHSSVQAKSCVAPRPVQEASKTGSRVGDGNDGRGSTVGVPSETGSSMSIDSSPKSSSSMSILDKERYVRHPREDVAYRNAREQRTDMPPVVDGKHGRVERRLARIITQYKRVKRPKTNSLASTHCNLSAIHKIGRTGGLCCSHRPPLNPTCSFSPHFRVLALSLSASIPLPLS